jgi:hypothetical protein
LGRGAVNLRHKPAVPATLEHHRHPVGVRFEATFAGVGFGAHGDQPGDRSGYRDGVALPLP